MDLRPGIGADHQNTITQGNAPLVDLAPFHQVIHQGREDAIGLWRNTLLHIGALHGQRNVSQLTTCQQGLQFATALPIGCAQGEDGIHEVGRGLHLLGHILPQGQPHPGHRHHQQAQCKAKHVAKQSPAQIHARLLVLDLWEQISKACARSRNRRENFPPPVGALPTTTRGRRFHTAPRSGPWHHKGGRSGSDERQHSGDKDSP